MIQREINVIQAPVALGQGLEGVDEGPKILLESGLVQQVDSLGWKVCRVEEVDAHDLTWNSPSLPIPAHQQGKKIKFPQELGKTCEEIAKKTAQSASENRFTLTLGGDHSIAIGTVSGALKQRPNLGVIWVDAHGDFNTPETSPSGNIHGMPLSFLSGLNKKYNLPGFRWMEHFLAPEQLCLVGIRSIDADEKKTMKALGIKVFSMTEIDRYGIGGVMEQALDYLDRKGARDFHLSYDIDAVDPHFAPSTGTRVRGGLNYREAHYIAERVAETERLVSMDLVEINPRLGYVDAAHREEKNITIEIGLELIGSALGKRIY